MDLAKGDAFGFLGFEFRRVRCAFGQMAGALCPAPEEANGALAAVERAVPAVSLAACRTGDQLLNPILRGWVTYFAIGHSTRCFGLPVRDWVEKKVRRHLMRARKRQGFGWKRWSRRWLYDTLGLFGSYRVHRSRQLRLKALPARIGPITLGMKRAGVRSAGNPHAAYDEAEVGNGVKGRTEAPDDGESPRQTATPCPCGHRASFRPYRSWPDRSPCRAPLTQKFQVVGHRSAGIIQPVLLSWAAITACMLKSPAGPENSVLPSGLCDRQKCLRQDCLYINSRPLSFHSAALDSDSSLADMPGTWQRGAPLPRAP